jgi:hypothetical protein
MTLRWKRVISAITVRGVSDIRVGEINGICARGAIENKRDKNSSSFRNDYESNTICLSNPLSDPLSVQNIVRAFKMQFIKPSGETDDIDELPIF